MNKKGFSEIIILIVLLVAGLVSLFVVLFLAGGDENLEVEEVQKVARALVDTPLPTPTPIPFEELTIPYLRNREYESEIVNVKEYSSNTGYTSYLASYDSDGFRVDGLLYVPSGNMPDGGWPAIVFVHGYIPPKEYETTRNYASYAEAYARNGFVVYKIDLRGHDESQGEPGGAYFSGDYVIDTLNAYAALENYELVNSEKIGLWGHSMAGNVTFRAFVVSQDIPAIVIWAGAVYTYEDMQKYNIQDTSYQPPARDSESARRRRELDETHGSFDEESNFWQMVVPTNYLNGVAGALQIHHARNDNVVSVRYSENLLKVLEESEIRGGLILYDSGGHNLTGSTFVSAIDSSVEFFEDYL